MKARIQRWGNSLALRIPRAIAADANLQQESEVDLVIADGKLVVTPIDTPIWSLEQLLRGVTPENLHGEADTGPAVGAEVW
jgi:antitoxin MazE